MKFNFKLLFFLLLIFSFLPSFYFPIGGQFVPLYIVFSILLFFLICILKPKLLLHKFLSYYKHTPFRYLVLFSIWAFVTTIYSILSGTFSLGGFINSTLGGLIVTIIFISLIVLFLVPRYIKSNTIITFIYVLSFFIFFIGILDFVINYFDISCLKQILAIGANKRQLYFDTDITQRIYSFGFPRIKSIFDEPSYLGYYCAIISPLIYEIVFNKILIFKNIYIEKLVKKIIIPIMWLNIILTQSPIYLIFNILISGYYFIFVRKILFTIIKNKFYLFCALLLLFLIIYFLANTNYSDTYLNRIVVFIQNIKSFSDFIIAEPSLATRIIIYINAIELGFKNIIFGVGYGNMSYLIATKLISSNVPLTQELIKFVIESKTSPASSIFVKIFSETAILGTFLYYRFLYLLIQKTNKVKYINNIPIRGLSLFCLFFFITSFYDSNINQPYVWILLSLLLCVLFYRKNNVII